MTLPDPGPMARLAEMLAEPDCMSVIVQRLTDVEHPETLEDIARSRKVPYGRLSAWITESRERTEQYANAMRIRAEMLAQQTVSIADGAGDTKAELTKAKLRIDTRLKMAGHLKPDTYGNTSDVNVNVKDNRTPTDREALVMEAARGVAFMLYAANRMKERASGTALLEAPAEPEPAAQPAAAQKGPI